MNAIAHLRRSPSAEGRSVAASAAAKATAGSALAATALAIGGYAIFSDARLAIALFALAVLCAIGLVGSRHPRTAVLASLALVLLAGTKFRVREADASLDGQIDAQILFELAVFA